MIEIRKITLQFPSLRAFLAEYGERVSVDGMLLRSESPPATGSTVDIEVVVAEGMRLLRARGETLWSGAAGVDGGHKAAAVKFRQLDAASRTLIDKIVDQRRREGAELFNLAAVPGPREARLRDLTVPAAAVAAEPAIAAPGDDSVFDLAAPPAASAAELFPADGGPETPAPAGGQRRPAAPVPLLDEAEQAPFDLGLEPPPGGEPDAQGGLLLDPAPATPPAAAARPPATAAPLVEAPAAEDDVAAVFEPPAEPPAEPRAEAPVFESPIFESPDGPPAAAPVLEPPAKPAAAAPGFEPAAEPAAAAPVPEPVAEPPAAAPVFEPAAEPPAAAPVLEPAAEEVLAEFTVEPPASSAAGRQEVAGGVEARIPPPGSAGMPVPDEAAARAAAERADLSELFGGDQPRVAPARGRTEAFPPSFVDEVEAELEAADSVDGAYALVDTDELDLQFGAPVDEPRPPAVAEASAAALGGPGPRPATEAEVEARIAAEPDDELEIEIEDLAAPEPPPAAVAPAAPPPPAAVPSAMPPLADRGPDTVEIPMLTPAEAPPPVVEPAAALRQASPPAEGQTPELALPELRTPKPPAAQPAATATLVPPSAVPPAAAAPQDDNLLSIPELGLDRPAGVPPAVPDAAAAPAVPVELPSSARALRGAAGRSRHLGTWLLIVLLAGALAVAGYFLLGLSRKGTSPPPATRAGAPALQVPDAAGRRPTRQPVGSDASAEQPPPPTGEARPAGDEAAPSSAAPAAQPPAVEPPAAAASPAESAPPAPAAPLTGLNRITWSETESETILALVGDGEIARRSVELVTLGGGQPRLVIKISGVERPFQPAVLEVGTLQVERVRTGLHAGGELHVVVDLAAVGVVVRDLEATGSRLEVRLGSE